MNPACPLCSGPGVPLGSLGSQLYLRCRNCGVMFSARVPEDEQPDWMRDDDDYTEPDPEREGQDRYIEDLDDFEDDICPNYEPGIYCDCSYCTSHREDEDE